MGDVRERARRMLRDGTPPREVAESTGLELSTVREIQRER